MAVRDDLLKLETQFWTGDADFYREHLDDNCLLAFAEMAGVMGKEDIARMVEKDPPQWSDLKFEDKDMIEPADDVAILSYKASGKRGTGAAYNAVVSSGYVKRGGEWKMAFHQQTPLAAAKKN